MLVERRLNDCKINVAYVVKCFEKLPRAARQRLQSLGIDVGSEIYLLQRFPVYVINCDYTQIALDHSLAKLIFVTKRDC